MYGQLLFTGQIISTLFCLFPLAITWPKPLVGLLLLLQILLGIWVLAVNQLGNWSVFPQPLNHAKLITSGPYGLVRHPMYSTMMLFGLTCLIHNQTLTSLLGFVILSIILRLKAGYEELLLRQRFDHYPAYMERTPKRFIPGII